MGFWEEGVGFFWTGVGWEVGLGGDGEEEVVLVMVFEQHLTQKRASSSLPAFPFSLAFDEELPIVGKPEEVSSSERT